ncbi:MAG: DNA alkylation repair enzyme [Methanobacterium sp. PtaB.Bin024]|jgi:3-methyladenine DNA glycosylase AlkD|nr:MAG: DNA alkylation repair enzyme [Methanobacterium sp. PtaB.Bin024]
MKPKTFRKKEILQITEHACDLLEEGKEGEFFDELEVLLSSKIPFGKLKPMGEYLGKRGLEKPDIYFGVLDNFFKKDLDYGYREGIYNTAKMRMSEEEVQKSRVWGWRAGIVGLALNEMSHDHPEEVVAKTREYILLSSHWSSSDTFADKTFNLLFKERFAYIVGVLKSWAVDENDWIRNAAAFAVHAPVERKIINKEQFQELLGVIDLVMEDPAKNVQKKTAWALKVVSKYYPDETYYFLEKWADNDDKNTKWIIKNSLKYLEEERRIELLEKNEN